MLDLMDMYIKGQIILTVGRVPRATNLTFNFKEFLLLFSGTSIIPTRSNLYEDKWTALEQRKLRMDGTAEIFMKNMRKKRWEKSAGFILILQK